MNRKVIPAFAIIFLLLSPLSCKDKKKEDPNKEKFFPVTGFIRGQVQHVDTSLYSIRKITFIDSVRTDTTYLRREDFAAVAHDFLSLPDIFQAEYQDRYTETKGFDETMGRAYLLYTPVNPDKEIIRDEKVLIQPDITGDRPTTIIINTSISNKDSLVEKNLLWQVDRSFLVTTIRQLAGQPEVTTTFKVVWNESDNE